MLSKIKTLDDLWIYVDNINKTHFPSNSLAPILGNGKRDSPRFMFVFINPTAKNISSDKGWKGPRFPFIGTKQVWRIFHRAGLFDDSLMDEIDNNPVWSVGFANQVLRFLEQKDFYLTNIVKWTGKDAALPDADKISLFLPSLRREIEIVKPQYIVTFGLIPFERLTGRKIRLDDYYSSIKKRGKLEFYDAKVDSVGSKVIPCYFPVGRGNPSRAIEILKMLEELK
jgi:DNA polymerase